MANNFFPAVQYLHEYQPENQLDQLQKAAAYRSAQQQQEQSAATFPLEQQQRQQQIQAGGQQLQIGQQQIQDSQAATAAMKEWDGKNMEELPGLLLKHGGSAQAVFGLRDKVISQKQNLLKLSSDEIANQSATNDQILGKLQALDKVPDGQLAQSLAGLSADPAHQQAIQQLSQLGDPQTIRDHLALYEKSLMGAKEQFSQANATQETEAKQLTAQTGAQKEKFEETQGGTNPESRELNSYLQANPGKTPADFLVWKNQHSPSILLQGGISGPGGGAADPMVDMVGQGRVDLASAVQRMPTAAKESFMAQLNAKYPQFRQQNYGVEKAAAENATSGPLAAQLLAINTAREHMKTFSSLADALDNGDVKVLNKIGKELGLQFGNDKKTNFDIASQAFGGEVGRALDGAGVVASERAEAQRSFNDAMSKGQFKGAVQTVDKLLAGKLKTAQDTYALGQQAKPNFGGNNQTATPGPGTAKFHYQGKNGEIFSDDGKTWFDGAGKKVGSQ